MEWRKLSKKVEAATDRAIETAGNAMLYLVMLALVMVGVGVGAEKFLTVANVSDPSNLAIVGQAFSGITEGISMGGVAVVVGFVGIIIAVLAGVWHEFRQSGFR